MKNKETVSKDFKTTYENLCDALDYTLSKASFINDHLEDVKVLITTSSVKDLPSGASAVNDVLIELAYIKNCLDALNLIVDDYLHCSPSKIVNLMARDAFDSLKFKLKLE